jgi:hypothetical protein
MARKKKTDEAVMNKAQPFIPEKIRTTSKLPTPVIPTENPLHLTKIRLGRFSAEQFCRDPERRRELGLKPFPSMESDLIDELRK